MVFVGLQITEPASAAKPKLIDHGKMTENIVDDDLDDGDNPVNYDVTVSWKTYQYSKKKIVIKAVEKTKYIVPLKNEEISSYLKLTFSKSSKKKVKWTIERWYISDGKCYDHTKRTSFEKYSSSINKYYKKKIKPDIGLLFYI